MRNCLGKLENAFLTCITSLVTNGLWLLVWWMSDSLPAADMTCTKEGFADLKVCWITWRFDDSGIDSAMMKPPDNFRCGNLLKTHEITGGDMLEIDVMRISNRCVAYT